MNAACCICTTPWPVEKLHRVDLTATEKAVVMATGADAVDHYAYCPACWAMMNNREQGAAFLAGVLEVGLRQAGVGDAAERAAKFRAFLLSRPVSKKA